MEKYIVSPLLCCLLFSSAPLRPRGSRLTASASAVSGWQHQSIKTDSYLLDELTEKGQGDSAFECVPQAFRKAPLCFTIGNICFSEGGF